MVLFSTIGASLNLALRACRETDATFFARRKFLQRRTKQINLLDREIMPQYTETNSVACTKCWTNVYKPKLCKSTTDLGNTAPFTKSRNYWRQEWKPSLQKELSKCDIYIYIYIKGGGKRFLRCDNTRATPYLMSHCLFRN